MTWEEKFMALKALGRFGPKNQPDAAISRRGVLELGDGEGVLAGDLAAEREALGDLERVYVGRLGGQGVSEKTWEGLITVLTDATMQALNEILARDEVTPIGAYSLGLICALCWVDGQQPPRVLMEGAVRCKSVSEAFQLFMASKNLLGKRPKRG